MGVLPLPDPAFLEIIGGNISRSLDPLAPSATRAALCRAVMESFLILASTGLYPGTSLLSAVRGFSRGGLFFEEIKNPLFWLWVRNKDIKRWACHLSTQQIASSRALWRRAYAVASHGRRVCETGL